MAQGPARTGGAYRILTPLCGENGDPILGDLRVAGDDREALVLGLGDEDPVERIAVLERKLPRRPRMLGGDRQRGEPPAEVANDVLDGRTELAGALFDRHLPDRRGTHRHEVLRLLDGRASLAGEGRVVDERPDDDVRVEQESQLLGSGGKISPS